MNQKVVQQRFSTVEKVKVEQILAMRETRKALQERLELVEKALSTAEDEIIGLIELGADVASAGYALSVNESQRRYPAWKEHFISFMGKAKADDILEATPATIYKKLVIK